MDSFKRIGYVIALSMLNMLALAQDANIHEEPNDFMRSNGKIYVVVAVIVTIVTGIFLYLLNLDRKIKKLEENKRDET
jgi:multisubunit Na+/H+ antiporter MnhB subunit